MTNSFVCALNNLLEERRDLQHMIFSAHGYAPVNVYNQHYSQIEDKLEDLLSLLDDHEYKRVLNVPVEEWHFINEFKK